MWSLAKLRKIGEDGVEFRSHVDGSLRFLSPEICVAIQHALGVDILHPLDECLAYPATVEATERSLALTLRWLRRSVAAHGHGAGALFGIVQGGAIPELRRRAVEEVCALDLDGHAIGGSRSGSRRTLMYATTELCTGLLPADRPRYLMGVGKPADLVECVARGVDMFDCVMPTRNARNGQAFTRDGAITISNARFARDPRTARPRMPLRGLPALLSGLSAPPVRGARAPGLPPPVAAQSDLLSGALGRHARPSSKAASRHSALGFWADMGFW